MKKIKIPLFIFFIFWGIAFVLWRTSGKVFYLVNFGYIGTAVGLGVGLYVLLPKRRKPSGRRLTQLLVGGYMLIFLGLLGKENMQLEGFFFYLLAGAFTGVVIHYMVAKLLGPLLFGRGFCGWACWTAMVLDFLPYKRNTGGRIAAKWELLRVAHFGASLSLVLVLWLFCHYRSAPMGPSERAWLIGGNVSYFLSAIILAFALKDNRAFCKYLCPITLFLKTASRYALLKIEGDRERCTRCGACSRACPMDIDVMAYVKHGERVLSTECIFCLTCSTVCPEEILKVTSRMDKGGKEYVRRRGSG